MFGLVRRQICAYKKELVRVQFRNFCQNATATQNANELFAKERRRQNEMKGRCEKIEVRFIGKPKELTLIVNGSVSTPYMCAQHISESARKSAVLALVDGTIPWDMHRPLEHSCTLSFLNFRSLEKNLVNKAFWRSCSFILGAAMQNIYESANLTLHSFPSPNVKSGSFVYDVVVNRQNWTPDKNELRGLSSVMMEIASRDIPIEQIEVEERIASEIFSNSPYKYQQIPSIAAKNKGRVTLYRIGEHIDISRGPMIASSGFIGRCTISAVHKMSEMGDKAALYRVQGVALPIGFRINHFSYAIIENNSKILAC